MKRVWSVTFILRRTGSVVSGLLGPRPLPGTALAARLRLALRHGRHRNARRSLAGSSVPGRSLGRRAPLCYHGADGGGEDMLAFPDPEFADELGIVAVGGDLGPR